MISEYFAREIIPSIHIYFLINWLHNVLKQRTWYHVYCLNEDIFKAVINVLLKLS